ncbi:MAG: hypothetical protein HXY43_12285 [Fischerella sp.]|uniref:hypothetical protein n=1 Tax=Fischerella sp. TaxID=1191 RepID=UPI0017CC581F|nr:hypothetical protein [Fischerella sp.]NWF60022.1 hypothetical protein [Fischerella sp.]
MATQVRHIEWCPTDESGGLGILDFRLSINSTDKSAFLYPAQNDWSRSRVKY